MLGNCTDDIEDYTRGDYGNPGLQPPKALNIVLCCIAGGLFLLSIPIWVKVLCMVYHDRKKDSSNNLEEDLLAINIAQEDNSSFDGWTSPSTEVFEPAFSQNFPPRYSSIIPDTSQSGWDAPPAENNGPPPYKSTESLNTGSLNIELLALSGNINSEEDGFITTSIV